MIATFPDRQPIAAREEDQLNLIELEQLLKRPTSETTTCQLVDGSGKAIDIPEPVFSLLYQMVQELLAGNSVTVVPIHRELTTQEAADILNVSRQYLVELLNTETIPYTKVGTHRRIRFGDLMDYKASRDAKRRKGLTSITQKSQKLGLYSKAANTLLD